MDTNTIYRVAINLDWRPDVEAKILTFDNWSKVLELLSQIETSGEMADCVSRVSIEVIVLSHVSDY